MDFSGMFETQVMLLLTMMLGWVLKKKGIVRDGDKTFLTNLVINVTLPASIIKSFQIQFDYQILMGCLVVCIIAVVVQIGSYLFSLVLYPGFHDQQKKVLQYATICSNAGVLGNAVAEGVFGSMGLLYASIYVTPQRIFMWSVGITYFTEAPDKKTLLKKIFTHPCILAAIIGILLMVTQLPLPGALSLTVRTVANANTCLAMMLVGTILADVRFRDLPGKETIYYTLIRLVLLPLAVFLGCRLAHMDALVTGVSVILTGMPAASTTAVMASKYEKDEVFATKCVVFSTILSMLSVPLWCLVMG